MKTWNYFITGISVCLMTAGCASMSDESTTVMLQHPETMEFVKCDVDQWGTKVSFAKNEDCIEEYKRQGYIIWAER